MARIGALHHVVFESTDLDRSERFYREVVGLDFAGRDQWAEDGPNLSLRADSGQFIVLVQKSEVPPDGKEVHLQLYLSLERWEEVADRLRRLGHPMRDERKGGMRAVGEMAVHVHDPDGHVLELNASDSRAYEVPAAGRGKVVAGRVDDFPRGSVTRIPQAQCFLVHLDDGFLALSQVCTHMQFTVTYQPEHYRFFCPRHRYRFGRTGACLPRGGRRGVPPLHAYEIEFDGEQIVIDTDTSVMRRESDVNRLQKPGSPFCFPEVDDATDSEDDTVTAAAPSIEFGRRAIEVNDLVLAEEFWGEVLVDVLGGEVDSRYMLTTEELLEAQRKAEREGADGAGGFFFSRPPYTKVQIGRSSILLHVSPRHVQEPPPEVLRGSPRVAIAVSPDHLDRFVETLGSFAIPFEGPVDHAPSSPLARSLYLKDPSGNFVELVTTRDMG